MTITSNAVPPLILTIGFPSGRYLFRPTEVPSLAQLGPWRLQDRPYVPGRVMLELVDVVSKDEGEPGVEYAVFGGEMMKRAGNLLCAGQLHAETLVRSPVPQEWSGLNVLFPGTKWITRDDRVWILALKCDAALARYYFFQAGAIYGGTFKIACAHEMAAN